MTWVIWNKLSTLVMGGSATYFQIIKYCMLYVRLVNPTHMENVLRIFFKNKPLHLYKAMLKKVKTQNHVLLYNMRWMWVQL